MSEIKRPENLSFKNAPIELKEDGDTRYIEAVFSLFDVIDSDNDVTKANALRSGYTGNKVPLVWNHDWSKVIGRGIIETDNQKAVFKGYFLNTEAGKEAYETVKAMQDMQQFSYGFQVLKSSKGTHIDSKGEEVPVRVLEDVKVWEVSPVLVGAQQNSFVQALKSGLEPVDEEIKAEMQVESTEPEVSSKTDAGISNSSQQGMRLGEQAVASLEELKAFTERIENLASLRHSEKKTLSSKSTEMIQTYLAGLNALYIKLDDVLAQFGYDPVKDDELFLEVQKNLLENNK
jgi:HK97 family phage prohead protease